MVKITKVSFLVISPLFSFFPPPYNLPFLHLSTVSLLSPFLRRQQPICTYLPKTKHRTPWAVCQFLRQEGRNESKGRKDWKVAFERSDEKKPFWGPNVMRKNGEKKGRRGSAAFSSVSSDGVFFFRRSTFLCHPHAEVDRKDSLSVDGGPPVSGKERKERTETPKKGKKWE